MRVPIILPGLAGVTLTGSLKTPPGATHITASSQPSGTSTSKSFPPGIPILTTAVSLRATHTKESSPRFCAQETALLSPDGKALSSGT